MSSPLERLQETITPLREEILKHPVYEAINDLDDLTVFMKYHAFAVWDFMSLLKALQRELTCTQVPWFPVGSADTRFLINEIVVGEESDVDSEGRRKSHFEIYLDAMNQSGADASCIDTFLQQLKKESSMEECFDRASVPEAARAFVRQTFAVIGSGQPHLMAATFTFGREDLIPGMFHSIIADIDRKFPGSISVFRYYLDRHIEVDGDHHSHLAIEMTEQLCAGDPQKWEEATQAALASLRSRKALWDGVYQEITGTSATAGSAVTSGFRLHPAQ